MPDLTENEKEYVNLVNELFRNCLTEKQLLVVKEWCAGGVPLVDVTKAYERTILQIGDKGGACFSYMSKIIERWQEKRNGNGILERAQRIDEKLQGGGQDGKKKKATRETRL